MLSLETILLLLLGYLVGSIPWALIIGKVFYKTDIREHGSGNLGGTNAGRVLGKKAGAIVMALDILKAFFVVLIIAQFNQDVAAMSGLACAIGHSYPIFAKFKGGKAVATTVGYLLGVSLFVSNQFILLFVVPVVVFLVLLKLFKMVSLASISAVSIAAILSFFQPNNIVFYCLVVTALFVIFRHRENIQRIRNKEEKKITWM